MFDTKAALLDEMPFDLLADSDPLAEERSRLERMVEHVPPGVKLAMLLAGVDRDSLSGYDRVALVKARSLLRSWIDAELLADIDSVTASAEEWVAAEVAKGDLHDVFYAAAAEIEAALTLTRRAAEFQTDLADRLCQRLPQVWEALHEGLIDLPRARVLSDQTTHLPEELARTVAHAALERGPQQTTGQLRARVQRLIISIDPAAAKDRYEEKMRERKLVCEPTDAGTANLYGTDLPADRTNQAMRRINRLARKAKNAGDRRLIDQIRADIFLDLLTGKGHEAIKPGTDRAQVDIRVDLTTLLGLDDNPAEIPGWGLVIADLARQIVEHQPEAEWQAGVTHHDRILDIITTRRRPSKKQRQAVQALNPDCIWPTCRLPFTECDVNHEIPWAETHHTTARELEPMCRHHHVNHHRRGWELKRLPNGDFQWTSPLGHTYTTGPDPP